MREEHVVSFVNALEKQRSWRGTPLALATREGWLSQVRGFFGFLVKQRLVLDNPASDVRLAHEERLPKGVLSAAQARRLMEAPSPSTDTGQRDRAILELFYGTGIRLGECSRLDVDDVDFVDGAVLVRLGKGRRDRKLPLAGRALGALDAYLKDARPELTHDPKERALFVSKRTGARLSWAGMQRLVHTHAKEAGIPGTVHPHALRHTCATHLLQGGAGIRHVQELLGHRSLRSTMLYTRVVTSDLAKVLARSHPRGL